MLGALDADGIIMVVEGCITPGIPSMIRLCLLGDTPVTLCFKRLESPSALLCQAHTIQTSVSFCKLKKIDTGERLLPIS